MYQHPRSRTSESSVLTLGTHSHLPKLPYSQRQLSEKTQGLPSQLQKPCPGTWLVAQRCLSHTEGSGLCLTFLPCIPISDKKGSLNFID